jgi:hypothetical protein
VCWGRTGADEMWDIRWGGMVAFLPGYGFRRARSSRMMCAPLRPAMMAAATVGEARCSAAMGAAMA